MIGSIILALIVGAIIGLVARLVMPGKQDIGMVATVLVGALGGLIGSAVASQFGYHNANGGVAWIPFFIGVAAAVVLIAIYESVMGRRRPASWVGVAPASWVGVAAPASWVGVPVPGCLGSSLEPKARRCPDSRATVVDGFALAHPRLLSPDAANRHFTCLRLVCGIARLPTSIPGLCHGFGNAARAAGRRALRRTSSATPCVGRCSCTRPSSPTSPGRA